MDIDKLNKKMKEETDDSQIISVKHRHAFLKKLGVNLAELGIKYGKVVFNFANSKCVGHNIEEGEKY